MPVHAIPLHTAPTVDVTLAQHTHACCTKCLCNPCNTPMHTTPNDCTNCKGCNTPLHTVPTVSQLLLQGLQHIGAYCHFKGQGLQCAVATRVITCCYL